MALDAKCQMDDGEMIAASMLSAAAVAVLFSRATRHVTKFQALHCRDQERKLARLHSEQARSAGQVQALSAVASHLPRQLPSAGSPPASSAGSNAESEDAAPSPTHSRGGAG